MKTVFLFVTALLLCVIGFSQNVGIGTNAPVFKLDVRNGSINTDSVYRIRGSTILSVLNTSNLLIGHQVGLSVTGTDNTFAGYQAGYSITTGSDNCFYGSSAGYFSTVSGANSFFGAYAGYLNIGNSNSFFGYNAGTNNYIGADNSFFGFRAGLGNTSGDYNSFFGLEAGSSNNTGFSNSFFGMIAGSSNTTGIENSFFGGTAGSSNTTGSFNTALGYDAKASTGTLSNATVIGYSARVDASNKVRIGNTSVTSIGGQVGWTSFSDGRFKHQVQEDVQGLAFIKKLRTVSYMVDLTALNNYYSEGKSEIDRSSFLQENTNNQSPEINRQSGFIAQEVEQAAKELGFSFSGIDKPQNEKALYGLRYGDFVVPLVKAVQEQQLIIETLQKQVEAAKAEIPMQIGKQQAMIELQNTRIEQQDRKIEMLMKEITLIKKKN